MKLVLSLLVMALALVGLIYVLKPEKKNKPQTRLKQKKSPSALPSAQSKNKDKLQTQPATENQLPRDPTMEEIRFAVRKYVTKFPGVTADVMQDWMKKRP
jgi:flagellar biosynthesis/type III secretory pathway M-ring protein FliF/YscJ